MIFGTAGHVDHGKTALVRALTGVDTDRLPDERRRGISIELGFAPLTLDDGRVVSIVDVPGHERFVDTMIAGASGIDAALLVIAATEGVMPQTREHCAVLRALRVPIAAIALAKTDRIDAESLRSRMDHIRASLARLGVTEAATVVPVSATTGDGVADVRAALTRAARAAAPRDPDDLFRFVVDRVFSVRGTGTVVTGTVWSGCIGAGDHVHALPGGSEWRVRAVQTHGSVAARAVAGGRFALALADALPPDIERGATLVSDRAWAPSARVAVALDVRTGRLPRRFPLQLGGARANARWVQSASDPRVLRLALDRPLVARRGDRVVIRVGDSADDGIVGATVLDPHPERGSPAVVGSAAEQIAALARAAGTRGLSRAAVPVRLGIVPREIAATVAAAGLRDDGERLLHPDAVSGVAAQLVELVERDASAHPFARGMAVEELHALLHAPRGVFEAALGAAELGGRVLRRGSRVVPAAGELPTAAHALLARVLEGVTAAGIEGVTLDEAARSFGPGVEEVLRYAERRGNLICLGGVRYTDASVVAAAVDRLRAAMSSGREFSPGELRGVFGVSRKYLIPLLEYCDATRVTIRRSGGRVLSDVSSR